MKNLGSVVLALLLSTFSIVQAETFRIAAYNVENYLDQPTESRTHVKSEAAKGKIRETILAIQPDVITFEEMGSTNALLSLRDSLKTDGLDLPYWEHVTGYDTNIHVAVLSRFPFTARRPHTNDSFLLSGRRFRMSRGIVELDVQVNTNYSFTLIAAHLKSRRPVAEADEAEMRLEEAKIVRSVVDTNLTANPNVNLVVVGDFNDTPNTASTKEVIGRGKTKLIDTRPAERNGDTAPNENPRYAPRNIAWTHYYGAEDSYSRIDYILLSPGMAHEWLPKETHIPTIPNWGVGSDHRPVVATFETENK